MKQTTNYHLNQWDPGDRILRTEFNGDNGKIDSAIQGVRRDLTAETTARKAAETTAANAVAGAKSEAATALTAESTARREAVTHLTAADSAVAGRVTALEGKTGLKLLRTVTIAQKCAFAEVVLTDIPWGSYKNIHLEIIPRILSSSTVFFKLKGSGTDECDLGTLNGNEHPDKLTYAWLTLFPMYDARRGATIFSISTDTGSLFHCKFACNQIAHLRLTVAAGHNILPDTLVRIYGEG